MTSSMSSREAVRALVFDALKYSDDEIGGLYEASLSRVFTHTQNRNIGILTAHRGGGEYTPEENRERNANLRDVGRGSCGPHRGWLAGLRAQGLHH